MKGSVEDYAAGRRGVVVHLWIGACARLPLVFKSTPFQEHGG